MGFTSLLAINKILMKTYKKDIFRQSSPQRDLKKGQSSGEKILFEIPEEKCNFFLSESS